MKHFPEPESQKKEEAVQAELPIAPPSVLPFELISQGAAEIQIEHAGQIYRLRATRNGRLVLNK